MQRSSPAAPETPLSPGQIRLLQVRKAFPGGVLAVHSVSLDVPTGQFLALIGPSGCGKSTLLRMIAGLDRPTSGAVEVSPGVPMAYVFQDAHLLPWRNVLRNVALPLELMGVARGERLDRAADAIVAVGLSDFTRSYPAQLSGGMRMRVSLARALVTKPGILLLDEPFAALDEITRQQLDDQLRLLWATRGMTVVFVTHSIMEATFLAERAVVFSPRPARVLLDHAIDLPRERTAALRGEARFAREMAVLFDALADGGGDLR